MKLRFTPRAVQDIAAIADYIRTRSPGAAERVRSAILQSLQNLVLFPQLGRTQAIEGVRKLVPQKYPYLVYFTGLMRRRRKSSSSLSNIPRVSGRTTTPDWRGPGVGPTEPQFSNSQLKIGIFLRKLLDRGYG